MRIALVFTTLISTSVFAAKVSSEKQVAIKGGLFKMGCTGCSLEDALPLHEVIVDSFKISETPVTNAQFRRFVKDTAYLTTAERPLDPKDFPGVSRDDLQSGSTLFRPPSLFRGLHNPLDWWEFKVGANWKKPMGPSGPKAKDDYPVVHVSFEDAKTYCEWRKGRLPTEAEYEYAARGGLKEMPYAWGDKLKPGGKWVANIWQGAFPVSNSKDDGFAGLSPVKAFPTNNYGLYDMGGNVWQWTADWYRPDYFQKLASTGSPSKNPKGPSSSYDPKDPNMPKRVQKGGSHLCSDNYCSRYFVGSRGKGEVSTGSGHLSFRCAW